MMKAKLLALTLCSAFLLSLNPSPVKGQSSDETGGQGRTWAVVIGISRYPKLPGGQQLQFAERDAADFADAIMKAGVSSDRVRLLVGQQATSSNIKSSIGNWLARSAWGADTVYVFFSGHAYVERDFGDAYILGFDSDLKDPYSTGLSLNELSFALSRRVRAGRVLIFADSIRRDFFPPESDATNSNAFFESLDKLAQSRPGLTAIVANGPGEFSREGQRWGGRGVFTKHLLDGLSGGADLDRDGTITASETFEYLSAKIPEDTSNRQRPWRTETAIARMVLGRSSLVAQSTARPSSPSQSPQSGQAQRPDLEAPRADSPAVEKIQAEKPVASEALPRVSQGSDVPRPGDTRKPVAPPPPTGVIASNTRPAGSAPGGRLPESAPASPAPPRRPAARPPETARVTTSTPSGGVSQSVAIGPIATRSLPPPPRPSPVPPSVSTVAASPSRNTAEAIRPSVPVSQPGTPPSPLALQIEAAIAAGSLIEPKNSSAWDLFQRLSHEQPSAGVVSQLRPRLASALLSKGRAIVGGDVRSDNIQDKVEEFRHAGQLLARARSLAPENAELQALEKLCASVALIALQFYDEAERSLSQLQGPRQAAVENALGIVFRGKLDDFRAERAFKRSIELDPKWAAPHYNLALLYKSQKGENVLDHLSRAAELDPSNPALQAALGDEHFERQQWQQAIEAYRKSVTLRPGDDTLHTKLGHALYSNGARDEANTEYQKAAEIRKRRP